jgi:hypothetical protein
VHIVGRPGVPNHALEMSVVCNRVRIVQYEEGCRGIGGEETDGSLSMS